MTDWRTDLETAVATAIENHPWWIDGNPQSYALAAAVIDALQIERVQKRTSSASDPPVFVLGALNTTAAP